MIGTRAGAIGDTDNERCEAAFNAWVSEGSLIKARLFLERNQILRSNGKPYSLMGVRYCAMKHVVLHYNDALEAILADSSRKGIHPKIENLEITAIGYAIEVFKYQTPIVEWAKEHGLYEKYEEFISEKVRGLPLESKRTGSTRRVLR